jgi:hypothetical protein
VNEIEAMDRLDRLLLIEGLVSFIWIVGAYPHVAADKPLTAQQKALLDWILAQGTGRKPEQEAAA